MIHSFDELNDSLFDSFTHSIHPAGGRHSNINNTTTMIQAAEEESEAEVRRVDQDNINKFARLNARLHELRDERDLLKVRSPLPPSLSLLPWSPKNTSLIPDSVAAADETTGRKANAWIFFFFTPP
jgi:hypothetical protein